MKPMILNQEQQISFISMCNNAVNKGHKEGKTKRQKNATTKKISKPKELTRKQIITVHKLEKNKEETSEDSQPENYDSQSDANMDGTRKDEEVRTNPLSKLFNKLSNKLIKKEESETKGQENADEQPDQTKHEEEVGTDGQQRQDKDKKKEKTGKKQGRTKDEEKENTDRQHGQSKDKVEKVMDGTEEQKRSKENKDRQEGQKDKRRDIQKKARKSKMDNAGKPKDTDNHGKPKNADRKKSTDGTKQNVNLMMIDSNKNTHATHEELKEFIHKIDGKIIREANQSCDKDTAKRIASADYIVLYCKNKANIQQASHQQRKTTAKKRHIVKDTNISGEKQKASEARIMETSNENNDAAVDQTRIDEKDSYVILTRNREEDRGLNHLIPTNQGLEVIRDYEHEPVDKLNQIANKIYEFNKEQVEIDGNEIKISLEDTLPAHKTRQPTKENSMDTENTENFAKISTIIKKSITREQNKCQETKDIIELVKRNVKPTRNESKSKTNYAKNLLASYEDLEIIDECLHINTMAYDTNQRTKLVIPDRTAKKALTMIHESCNHIPPWKMVRQIMNEFHIHDIKKLNNDFQCKTCNLRPKPTHQEQLSPENLGETIECDLLQMVPTVYEGATYDHIMVITETSSKFAITEKLKNNSDKQIVTSIMKGLNNSSLVPKFYTLKGDLATRSKYIAEKLANKNMQQLTETVTSKNSTKTAQLADNSTLLKNSLNKTDSWPESLPSATLALNATLRRYHLGPDGITSSSNVFNGREPTIVLNNDTSLDIANTIMVNNETAFNDTLSYINTEDNGTFDTGQIVMIRKEFISGAVKVGKCTTKLKVKTYWTPAKVINQINGNSYTVKLRNGSLRKVHKIICKNLNDDVQQEPESQFENR